MTIKMTIGKAARIAVAALCLGKILAKPLELG
jgi:hypothetical protein